MKNESSFRRLLKRSPLLYRCARRLKWYVSLPIWRIFVRVKCALNGLHVDPFRIYWVSPHAIKHTLSEQPAGVSNPATVSGVVKRGNWDRNTMRVEDMDIVRSFEDHFSNGKAWEETEFYQSRLSRIYKGETLWECSSKRAFDKRCKFIDELFADIKNNGYKSQAELRRTTSTDSARVEHEITVHIDRDGQFLLCDGRHRLAIARICGVERVPVKVCLRHSK
jgi:hypothetical protein